MIRWNIEAFSLVKEENSIIKSVSMSNSWNPNLYVEKHDYVFKYGEEIITLLAPENNESILDIGCGTGDLTKKISDSCKKVIGLDNSVEMIRAAIEKYPEITFIVADAKEFQIDRKFDAVFSNAALHWMPQAEKVIQNINKHLRIGGRFVAELGGKKCVNRIITALTDMMDLKKIDYPDIPETIYYPSIGEYSGLLESNGFELIYAVLFDRPTELKDGIKGLHYFIEMFFNWLFVNVTATDKSDIIETACDRLKPELFNGKSWVADYRRLRITAIKEMDMQ